MKRVLITGGGGFVGKAIVRQLLQENVDCFVLGRNDYPDPKRAVDVLNHSANGRARYWLLLSDSND